MKKCSKCGCEKPLSDFYVGKQNKDGYCGQCKACKQAANKAWEKANPEKMRTYKFKWEVANKDKVAAKTRRWYEANKDRKIARDLERDRRNKRQAIERKARWLAANKEKADQAHKEWAARNPEKLRAQWARRRAVERKATPSWAVDFFIEEAYTLAKLRTEMLGFAWHVDHIVPLRSKHVCGLHTHDNLRVIPGSENIAKGNRHWPDQP